MAVLAGWYECASELTRGSVVAARVGDVELVVWCDDRGAVHVQRAHCPHLGAHLGYGGRVVDDTLRCPFHGWRFAGDGSCASAYAADPVPPAAIEALPAVERVGAVFAWIGTSEPFALPELPWFTRRDAVAPPPLRFEAVDAVVEDFVENAADTAHFETVHRTAAPPVLDDYDLSGPVARFRTSQQYRTPRGAVSGRLDLDLIGPGVTYTEYTGLFEGAALTTVTPTGIRGVDFTVRLRFAAGTDPGLVDAFIEGSRRQIARDFDIWAHRVHHEAPHLLPGDGPILELRRWLEQFR